MEQLFNFFCHSPFKEIRPDHLLKGSSALKHSEYLNYLNYCISSRYTHIQDIQDIQDILLLSPWIHGAKTLPYCLFNLQQCICLLL